MHYCNQHQAEQLRYQLEQQYGSLGVVSPETGQQEKETTSILVNAHGGVDTVSSSHSGNEDIDVGALYVTYINRNFAVSSRTSDALSKTKTMTS